MALNYSDSGNTTPRMEGLEESATMLDRWNDWRDVLRFVVNHCENYSDPGVGVGTGSSQISSEFPRGSSLDNVTSILDSLTKRIQAIRSKSNRTEVKGFSPISENAHFSAMTQSLSFYLSATLSSSEAQDLSDQIDLVTSNWLKSLFGVAKESVGVFSPDESKARFFVAQAALHGIHGFSAKGFQVLAALEPVIYVGDSFAQIGEQLALYLGFPRKNIHFIKIPYGGGGGAIDVSVLEEAVELDKSEGRTPFLVVASADMNQSDDIPAIRQLCVKYNMWLHVEGDALALLMAKSTCPPSIAAASQADSFSVNFSKWYGLAAGTTWTRIAKPVSESLHKIHSANFQSLSLWTFLERMGRDYFEKTVVRALELSTKIYDELSSLPTIEVIQVSPPSLLFRYVPNLSETGESADRLLNNLNQQILIDLCANPTAATLGLQLISAVESNLCYILFQPLFSIEVLSINDGTISEFMNILKMETTLIDSTLQCQEAFRMSVERFNDLSVVQVDNFVGLGAVRYVPSYLSQALDTLAPDVAAEIDSLNSTLAFRLSDDPLYSESKTTDGSICVSLGVDTKPITPEAVDLYVDKLYKIARHLELSSKIVEKVAEHVQRGIKLAQDELSKEEANILYQEGIVRKLPIVGSMWNWMMPFEKPALQGRSFDLASQSLQTVSSPKLRSRIITPSSSAGDLGKRQSTDLERKGSSGSIPFANLNLSSSAESSSKTPSQPAQEQPPTANVAANNVVSSTSTVAAPEDNDASLR
eukprot:TRINITY_DN8973_c0_g1_i1.p1 TRINITY_DN8973_c0_g1~~TRINITY_DN8973_c0_g1_i1.p1  ORF type:complete len:770 (-),score=192.75 TRINITY_DN8973_c0_g1_i1:43-2319(-)